MVAPVVALFANPLFFPSSRPVLPASQAGRRGFESHRPLSAHKPFRESADVVVACNGIFAGGTSTGQAQEVDLGTLRFFRRVRIAPGLTLNLSKHGASLSAGVRGAHVTVGRTGIRRTVGLPGTGIFCTSHTGLHTGVHTTHHLTEAPRSAPAARSSKNLFVALVLCGLLGLLGAHRFYTGHWVSGILMALLTLSGAGLMLTIIWWPIDFLIILLGQFHDSQDDRVAW